MARIEIRQRLHEGIYRSQGGGQTRTVKAFNFGPVNWKRAAELLVHNHVENVRCYGSIGCGATWAVLVDDAGEVNVTGLLREFLDYSRYHDWHRRERDYYGSAPARPSSPAEAREWVRRDEALRAAEDARMDAESEARYHAREARAVGGR